MTRFSQDMRSVSINGIIAVFDQARTRFIAIDQHEASPGQSDLL